MTRGQRIKQLMDENEIDAQELANAIGKQRSYIYELIKDRIKNPSYDVMKGIASKFGVSEEFIENGIDEEIIYYDDPDILKHLPNDLKEFVINEESTPYLTVAKMLEGYDLKKITPFQMNVLIEWLRDAIKE
jgi:transcriptional regulator with XRE-family HTH domain